MASTGKVIMAPASPVKTAALEISQRGGGDMAAPPDPPAGLFRVDLALRLVLLSSAAASLAMVFTSDQTQMISSPLLPAPISLSAKFRYSSAITYSVGTTSAVCLYSILSSASTFVLAKRPSPSARLLLLRALLDAVMAAVLGSGTGAVSSVAYIALKGNAHVGWHKVCDVFDDFCRHIGSSIALDVAALLVLVALVFTSTYSLYRRSAGWRVGRGLEPSAVRSKNYVLKPTGGSTNPSARKSPALIFPLFVLRYSAALQNRLPQICRLLLRPPLASDLAMPSAPTISLSTPLPAAPKPAHRCLLPAARLVPPKLVDKCSPRPTRSNGSAGAVLAIFGLHHSFQTIPPAYQSRPSAPRAGQNCDHKLYRHRRRPRYPREDPPGATLSLSISISTSTEFPLIVLFFPDFVILSSL